jgi:hypothetical protein
MTRVESVGFLKQGDWKILFCGLKHGKEDRQKKLMVSSEVSKRRVSWRGLQHERQSENSSLLKLPIWGAVFWNSIRKEFHSLIDGPPQLHNREALSP